MAEVSHRLLGRVLRIRSVGVRPLLGVLVAFACLLAGREVAVYGSTAVVAAVVLGLTLVILTRPMIGLYLLAFSIPLENTLVLGGEVTIVRALSLLVFASWAGHTLLFRGAWSQVFKANIVLDIRIFT